MKRQGIQWAVASVGAVSGIVVVVLVLRDRAPATPAPRPTQATAAPSASSAHAPSAGPASVGPGSAPAPAVRAGHARAVTSAGAAPHRPAAEPVHPEPRASGRTAVRVASGRTLATVNGVRITLRHLVPLAGEGPVTRSMTPEEYQHRLDRAVETELVLQAARDRNIGLTPEQERRVAEVRARRAAEIAAARSKGLQWTSLTREQIEFEVEQTKAALLRQNLLARSGGPSPGTGADYAAAVRQLLDRLRSGAAISTISYESLAAAE